MRQRLLGEVLDCHAKDDVHDQERVRGDGGVPQALREHLVEVERNRGHGAGREQLTLSLRQRTAPVMPVGIPYLEVFVVAAALHDPPRILRKRCHLGHA